MMADMNAETIQQRIQIARRDAEGLKDRIKRKKDELADTTRQYSPWVCPFARCLHARVICLLPRLPSSSLIANLILQSVKLPGMR